MARSLFPFLQVGLDESRNIGVGRYFQIVAQVHHALVQLGVHPQGYRSAVAIIASSTAFSSLPSADISASFGSVMACSLA